MADPMEGVVEFVREHLPKLNPHQEICITQGEDHGYLAVIIEHVKGEAFPDGIKWEKGENDKV